MSNKYFKPIDFNPPKEDESVPPVDIFKTNLTKQLNQIVNETNKIRSGQSKHVPMALHFKDDKIPVLHAVEIVRKYPNRRNVVNMLHLAKQDFGLNAARYFATLFHDIEPDLIRELDD